jgi:hypothetical protein
LACPIRAPRLPWRAPSRAQIWLFGLQRGPVCRRGHPGEDEGTSSGSSDFSGLDDKATERLASLLKLCDPGAEVAIAYRIKERLRDFYRESDADKARCLLEELKGHCLKVAMPPEVQKLGRAIEKWFDKICNYHSAKMTNGPTESINNLIKRVKRVGFGFRNFENYRVRALLYAGKPNWRVLASIVVR